MLRRARARRLRERRAARGDPGARTARRRRRRADTDGFTAAAATCRRLRDRRGGGPAAPPGGDRPVPTGGGLFLGDDGSRPRRNAVSFLVTVTADSGSGSGGRGWTAAISYTDGRRRHVVATVGRVVDTISSISVGIVALPGLLRRRVGVARVNWRAAAGRSVRYALRLGAATLGGGGGGGGVGPKARHVLVDESRSISRLRPRCGGGGARRRRVTGRVGGAGGVEVARRGLRRGRRRR